MKNPTHRCFSSRWSSVIAYVTTNSDDLRYDAKTFLIYRLIYRRIQLFNIYCDSNDFRFKRYVEESFKTGVMNEPKYVCDKLRLSVLMRKSIVSQSK